MCYLPLLSYSLIPCQHTADPSENTAFGVWEALAGSGETQRPLSAWVCTTELAYKDGWINFHLGSVSRTPLNAREAQTIQSAEHEATGSGMQKEDSHLALHVSLHCYIVSCTIQQIVRDKQPSAVHNAKNSRYSAEHERTTHDAWGP